MGVVLIRFSFNRVVILMWHTPTGDRVLLGAEAELIQASVRSMVEDIHRFQWDLDEDGFYSEIELFDGLTWTHKLSAIEQVARFLLTDTSDALPLNAINEAVVGAIFENVRQLLMREIHFSPAGSLVLFWREKVLAAVLETTSSAELAEIDIEEMVFPEVTCADLEIWSDLVEFLADRILWDRDYELAAAFMDDDPAVAAAEKQLFGIDDDYFTSLPPDLRDNQLESVVVSIEKLVRAKPR